MHLGRLICLALVAGAPACMDGGPAAAGTPGPADSALCEDGEHACGATCVADRPDRPEDGCAHGCGPACPAPDHGVAVCSAVGTCDFTCEAPWQRQGASCVPTACTDAGYTCGTLPGSGESCGSCVDGIGCGADQRCAIAEDAREPNDDRLHAGDLGALDDADDPSLWVDDLNIHGATDEDWFRFHLLDGFDGGDPAGFVQLSDRMSQLGWLAADHELTVWFRCDAADAGSSVACGEWHTLADDSSLVDPDLGVGCAVNGSSVVWADVVPRCSGVSDDGVVTIRIRKTAPARGDAYDLFVRVE